jgi:uncharacterized membrane protein
MIFRTIINRMIKSTGEWKATMVATLVTLGLATLTKVVPEGAVHEFLYVGEMTTLFGLVFFVVGVIKSVHDAPENDDSLLPIGVALLCWFATVVAVIFAACFALVPLLAG